MSLAHLPQQLPQQNYLSVGSNVADSQPSSDQKPPLSLSFFLNVWRQWWLIALPIGLLLAGVACTLVFMLFTPIYRSTAAMRINNEYLAFNRTLGINFFNNQVQLIRSPLVLQEVVTKPEVAQIPEVSQSKDAIDYLAQSIEVTRRKDSDFFEISFQAADPQHAKQIAEAVSKSYERLQADYANARTKRIIDLLEEEKAARVSELERLRGELRSRIKVATGIDPYNPYGAEKRLTTSADGENVVRLQSGNPTSPLLQLQTQITEVEMEIAMSKAKLEANRLGDSPQAPTAAAINNRLNEDGRIQQLVERIRLTKQKLVEEEAIALEGTDPPPVQQIRKQIKSDEELLAEMKKELLPTIEAEMVSDAGKGTELESERLEKELSNQRIQLQVLEDKFQTELGNLKDVKGESLELEFLRAEMARASAIVDLLADRLVRLRTEERSPPQVELFDEAKAPAAPIQAIPVKQMLLFGSVCLAFPFGLALLWELRVRRVSDTATLEQTSHVPVIGQIARLPVRRNRDGSSSELLLFEESIDSLRTGLTLTESLQDMQVLVVTSAASQEGKTSVASQLAVSIARSTGEATLLIDGDMRSPDINNVFDVDLEPGLAEVLEGDATFDDAIIDDWSERVHLMTGGRLKTNPHRLVGNGLREVLEEARKRYRYIVIDTPPVLAASESLVIAKMADATLVCTMRDVSRLDQVRLVCQRLRAANAHPAGIVLNGVPTKRYAYDYGYGYGYGYRYGYVRSN